MKNHFSSTCMLFMAMCLFASTSTLGMDTARHDTELNAYLSAFFTEERVASSPLAPEDQASILEARAAVLHALSTTQGELVEDAGYQDNMVKIHGFFQSIEAHLEEPEASETLLENTTQNIQTLLSFNASAQTLGITLKKVRTGDVTAVDTLHSGLGNAFASQIVEGTQRLSDKVYASISKLKGRTLSKKQGRILQGLTNKAKKLGIKNFKKTTPQLEHQHIAGICNNLYEVTQAQAAQTEYPDAQVKLGIQLLIKLNPHNDDDTVLIAYAQQHGIKNSNTDGDTDHFIITQEFDVSIVHEDHSREIRECKNVGNNLSKYVKAVPRQAAVLHILEQKSHGQADAVTVANGSIGDLLGAQVILQAPALPMDERKRDITLFRLARAHAELFVGSGNDREIHIGHNGVLSPSRKRPREKTTPQIARKAARRSVEQKNAGATPHVVLDAVIPGSTTRAGEILEGYAIEWAQQAMPIPIGRITPAELEEYLISQAATPGGASPAMSMLLSRVTTPSVGARPATPVDVNFIIDRARETSPGYEAILSRSSSRSSGQSPPLSAAMDVAPAPSSFAPGSFTTQYAPPAAVATVKAMPIPATQTGFGFGAPAGLTMAMPAPATRRGSGFSPQRSRLLVAPPPSSSYGNDDDGGCKSMVVE